MEIITLLWVSQLFWNVLRALFISQSTWAPACIVATGIFVCNYRCGQEEYSRSSRVLILVWWNPNSENKPVCGLDDVERHVHDATLIQWLIWMWMKITVKWTITIVFPDFLLIFHRLTALCAKSEKIRVGTLRAEELCPASIPFPLFNMEPSKAALFKRKPVLATQTATMWLVLKTTSSAAVSRNTVWRAMRKVSRLRLLLRCSAVVRKHLFVGQEKIMGKKSPPFSDSTSQLSD